MSRKTDRTPPRDAIAEQSLAATLRKLIDGDIALQFPKVETIGEGENEVALINPPVLFKLSRAVKGTSPPLRLSYDTPFNTQDIADDKSLAIALAIALRGFLAYEEAAIKKLPPDITGNGHAKGRIIIPGEG